MWSYQTSCGRIEVKGRRVGVILSGGNVDLVFALGLMKELGPE